MRRAVPRSLPFRILATTLLVIAGTARTTVQAGDWPQILGPARNGTAAADERILNTLPPGGARILWDREVGEGFAGAAVASERVVLFHRQGNREIAECFAAETGEPLWSQAFPASYSGSIAPDNGPRCVPLIHADSVYLCGAAGDVHCLGLTDGKVRWTRPLYKEAGSPEGYFGAGSSPLVEAGNLLINTGGKQGAGLMALSLSDGKTLWSSTDEQASYSSPTAATIDGQRQVVFVTRLNCISVDPKTGKVHWRFPFGARGPTVNAATPLVFDDHLFLSASYGVGAVYARLKSTGATEVWANNDTMSSQYTTCVLHQGLLYGVDGRADQGGGRLRCFEPQTGNVRWTKENFGVAHAILADGKLILLKDDGVLVLVSATAQGYQELGRQQVLKTTARALPALSAGRLFVRDTRRLVCVNLERP